MPRIPLIEDLTKGPVPPGSSILVEFDSASQWYNASVTIAAGWLRTGGSVGFVAMSLPPDELRSQIRQLGLNTEELEQTERLSITDAYSASIGQKSKEKFAVQSLKVTDLSLYIGRESMSDPSPAPEFLTIADNISILDRFNAEKNWVEMYLTRPIPMAKARQITNLNGIIGGIHSDWAYKQLEAAVDGIIDFKLDATSDPPQNLIRIRNMRKVGFDGRWNRLKTEENFEVTLEK
ncbi:MAG: ATPase domain-containing protein [Candidatus Bathyarchaeia archaeon]